MRGVHAHVDLPDSRELRADAVGLLIDQDLFLLGPTAAWVLGADIHAMGSIPKVWVGSDHDHRPRKQSEWLTRSISPATGEVIELRGVRLTSPTRTSFDCLRWLKRDNAIVIADSLIFTKQTTREAISLLVDKGSGMRGIVRARGALPLLDGRAESPPETRTRLLLVDGGYHPEPQHEVYQDGRFIARLDLALVELKIAVEYDGRGHRQTGAADERRRAKLRELGWTVLVVYAEDMATDAGRSEILARVSRAVTQRTPVPRAANGTESLGYSRTFATLGV